MLLPDTLQKVHRVTLRQIIDRVQDYLPGEDLTVLEKAYAYAKKVHGDKKRISGHSYMSHLLAVGLTLATMRLDLATITAGLLHGTLKEHSAGSSSREEMEELFGADVVAIINGNTKITNVTFNSRMALQAENVRKMFVAMSADLRVLLVKLADRLHDMQTLQYLPPHRQAEVARETMDLYAPLASRLGIDWLKRELEDLAFSFIHPREFKELATKIKTSVAERQIYVDRIQKLLSEKLTAHGINDFQILGRPKHLYSIYRKLMAQKIPLEKVYDKVAFRIIVHTLGECYEVLGLIHSMWVPVSGRYKDFIGTPKSNMYQSLHTSVVGPDGEFMEIQIRTKEMDRVAKEGIAAHWAYKEGKAVSQQDARLFQWFKQFIQELKDLKDPREFLEAVKSEVRSAQVYVLTPGGEVKELPLEATPLDFAYSIHSKVGDHCVGAKVNGRIVPLKHALQNGDMVEIITSAKQQPSRAWLSIIKTSRARSHIRNWLNREEKERSLELGRELVERELRKHSISLKKESRGAHFQETLKTLGCSTLEELLRKAAYGKITTQAMVEALRPEEAREEEALAVESMKPAASRKPGKDGGITIDGIGDVMVKVSKCCMPVPGDDIMGFITAGRGISIHKVTCPNFLATDALRHVEVNWTGAARAVHRSQIHVTAHDKKGLLASVSKAISTNDANIIHLEATSTEDHLAMLTMDVEVADLKHLNSLLLHLRQLEEVITVERK